MNTQLYSGYPFKHVAQFEHAQLTHCAELKMAICSAQSDYIPISEFKNIFNAVTALLHNYPTQYLLFDKRQLRTFHQPSMEWYFAVWKQEAKSLGLNYHFKILPELEWFEKAVEAGKHEIFQKYGKDVLNGIEVVYVNSVEEAISTVVSRILLP